MPSSLPRGKAADQGVDPAAILRFLDALDERPDIEMHSLMVVRHGRVAAEGAVWSVVIVKVEPAGERGGAFVA